MQLDKLYQAFTFRFGSPEKNKVIEMSLGVGVLFERANP
jgi:hypothetical protein